MGYKTDTEMIFYVLQLFNQLSTTIGLTLPANFSRTSQFYAAIIRLDNVLLAKELDKADNDASDKPSVVLRDVSFDLGNREILQNISMTITKPGLTMVTGAVGSGKSSLLKIILQDYQPVKTGKNDLHRLFKMVKLNTKI